MKIISPEVKGDGCSGTVKIQGLMWECVQADAVASTVAMFRKRLIAEAQTECKKHCQRRSRDCDGFFSIPNSCGLDTNREDAVIMGKREGCRSDCKGPAFSFCSLYDAGFRSSDDERMAAQVPNCRCSRRKK